MATELMKYNSSFCEKVDTHANYLPMWEALYDIDRFLQECDAELESIGLGIGYQSMEDDIYLLGEQLNILQDFAGDTAGCNDHIAAARAVYGERPCNRVYADGPGNGR